MNCQPNDLAICIGTEIPKNNGLIVTVVRAHTNEGPWNFGDAPTWWCKSAQMMTWRFRGTRKVVRAKEGPVPDKLLRPIRPDKDPAPTATLIDKPKEELPAEEFA